MQNNQHLYNWTEAKYIFWGANLFFNPMIVHRLT